MFEYMIKENDLLPEFRKYDLFEDDILFIKEQIFGPISNDSKLRVILADANKLIHSIYYKS